VSKDHLSIHMISGTKN